MRRALVTGARGFIGRQTLPLLSERGFEVHAVTSGPVPEPEGTERWERADLLDPRAVDQLIARVRPTHLLHLAWFAKPGEYATSPLNMDWLGASLHLVQRFAESGGKRVVGAGTCFEYDWSHGFCREFGTPAAPSTLYGACKHGLYATLDAFCRESGLSAAWGRIFFLYGPHEAPRRLVSSVVQALLRGEEAPCSPGTQIRDFLHVRDVAGAFVHLLDSQVAGPVNIASGDPVAVKEVIASIAEVIGRPELVRLGALPSREGEPHLLVADVTRLTDEVGFRPRFDLRNGIAETVRWWRKQLMGIDPVLSPSDHPTGKP